jgi:hypothetical protein
VKRLAIDESAVLKLLHRWRDEAEKQDPRSNALQLPSRPSEMVSGQPAGSGRAAIVCTAHPRIGKIRQVQPGVRPAFIIGFQRGYWRETDF